MPLLWLSLAFLAGIIVAAIFTLPTTTWLILSGVLFLLALLGALFKRARSQRPYTRQITLPNFITPPLPFPVLMITLALGAARYQAAIPIPQDTGFIAHYNDTGSTMIITGVVVGFPDVRDTYTNLRVESEHLRPANATTHTPVQGLLLARVSNEGEFNFGDRIVLRGQLKTPPEHEDFSYRDYLARQGVYSYMSYTNTGVLETGQGNPIMQAIFTLKEHALETVYLLWPDPEASLFAGILLGIETGIPAPVQEDFKSTGTSHVIAISGFNNPVSQIVHPRYHQVSLQW
jgi:competence protein ComEC